MSRDGDFGKREKKDVFRGDAYLTGKTMIQSQCIWKRTTKSQVIVNVGETAEKQLKVFRKKKKGETCLRSYRGKREQHRRVREKCA